MGYWKKEIESMGGKDGDPLLRLDLDDLYTQGYTESAYDISGAGHSRLILARDREAFLDELAAKFRAQAADCLKPYVEDE